MTWFCWVLENLWCSYNRICSSSLHVLQCPIISDLFQWSITFQANIQYNRNTMHIIFGALYCFEGEKKFDSKRKHLVEDGSLNPSVPGSPYIIVEQAEQMTNRQLHWLQHKTRAGRTSRTHVLCCSPWPNQEVTFSSGPQQLFPLWRGRHGGRKLRGGRRSVTMDSV